MNEQQIDNEEKIDWKYRARQISIIVGSIVVFGTLIIMVLSSEQPGVSGDDVTAVLTVHATDGSTNILKHPMPGKILRVRFVPSGKGVNVRIQTPGRWYALYAYHWPIDHDHPEPVRLAFIYKAGKGFRSSVRETIDTPYYSSGLLTWPHIPLEPARDIERYGDIALIAFQKGEKIHLNTTRNFGRWNTAAYLSPKYMVEIFFRDGE